MLVVNHDNPLQSLTRQEVAELFRGATDDWSKVGAGNFQGIVALAGLVPRHGTAKLFAEVALNNQGVSKSINTFNSHTEVLKFVAEHPRAIGFVSLGLAKNSPLADKVKLLSIDKIPANEVTIRGGSYYLSRPLLLVTKGLPTGNVAKLVGYLLGQDGQDWVSKEFIAMKVTRPVH